MMAASNCGEGDTVGLKIHVGRDKSTLRKKLSAALLNSCVGK